MIISTLLPHSAWILTNMAFLNLLLELIQYLLLFFNISASINSIFIVFKFFVKNHSHFLSWFSNDRRLTVWLLIHHLLLNQCWWIRNVIRILALYYHQVIIRMFLKSISVSPSIQSLKISSLMIALHLAYCISIVNFSYVTLQWIITQ